MRCSGVNPASEVGDGVEADELSGLLVRETGSLVFCERSSVGGVSLDIVTACRRDTGADCSGSVDVPR